MPAVLTTNLSVKRGDTTALSDVNLTMDPGMSLAVIGPNGSGKSTLLAVLAGIVKPNTGQVSLKSRPALVQQSTDVDHSLPITVWDTVALGRYRQLGLFRPFRRNDRKITSDALDRLEVSHLACRQLHDLSGGQRQRVLVAQGIAQEAEILLLDEPSTGLDIASHQTILRLINQEVAANRVVITTTHNLSEARQFDRVLLLDSAAIAFGPPDEVLTEECLSCAFGGHIIRINDEPILDDPHHLH